MSVSHRSLDHTLPDDAWKDSFDKLLDPIPHLRELNILKRDVRASFNMDSSVENSNPNIVISSVPNQKSISLKPPDFQLCTSISTPCAKRVSAELFNCGISPIVTKLVSRKGSTAQQVVTKLPVTEEPPLPRKRVCFGNVPATPEQRRPSKKNSDQNRRNMSQSTNLEQHRRSKATSDQNGRESRSSLILQPGKWRKSLCHWRRTHAQEPARISGPKKSLPACPPASDCSVECVGVIFNVPGRRKSIYIKDEPIEQISHEQRLLAYCEQSEPLPFVDVYAATKMPNSCKIGEGVYGEVFKYTVKKRPKIDVVLKVIPIEGSLEINGEAQKTYEQMLPEIIISKEMCNLRTNKTNSTAGFVDIYKVCLVKGKYPAHLLELWEKYDDEKESENDHPEVFMDDQLFVVLELKFAGQDMSTFTFTNAEQSYYALQQIMLTLAVGEEAYQFEHRDLHWGNILIEPTTLKQLSYKLNGISLTVPTKGLRLTIIDYTLSRITFDTCCHYNDLSSDEELFAATGDYQYDIYRMMREELGNDWTKFSPKTNVMWLSYVTAKLIDGVKYRSINTKTHHTYMEKLKDLQTRMLTFESAAHCVKSLRKLVEVLT
ncbi:putative serine/threonine-protein kinase haspin homolog [Scaptodrosophila lebanonensis]|uniref:non-specific serine/threonine protein kinase n=1 Tax=Drosophila lebanonensis TaxID=7225 RepID=A0A6J2UCG7_DROLE|nr:putative serine/threonine-protein kinase haspin homolog [Scaptodrosophila lebanonensis]